MVSYVNDTDASETAFDISSIPKVSRQQAAQEAARKARSQSPRVSYVDLNLVAGPSTLDTIGAPVAKNLSPSPQPPTAEETHSIYLQQLAEVPELSSYGPVLNSSAKPVQLTETETEYQVSCVKHIFKEHIVFQVGNISSNLGPGSLIFSTVQRVQHIAGYNTGRGHGHHAALRGLWTDRGFHHSSTFSVRIYLAWHRLCVLHP